MLMIKRRDRLVKPGGCMTRKTLSTWVTLLFALSSLGGWHTVVVCMSHDGVPVFELRSHLSEKDNHCRENGSCKSQSTGSNTLFAVCPHSNRCVDITVTENALHPQSNTRLTIRLQAQPIIMPALPVKSTGDDSRHPGLAPAAQPPGCACPCFLSSIVQLI